MNRKHSHYFHDVTHLTSIDVYRVLDLFGVTNPCLQHAIKKLLVAGGRGVKNMERDVQEAIDTLERWKEMFNEDQYEKKCNSVWSENSDLPLRAAPQAEPNERIRREMERVATIVRRTEGDGK